MITNTIPFLDELISWWVSWSGPLQALFSIILTASLVGLYYKQHDVLENQLKRESNPEVVVEDVTVIPSPMESTAYDYHIKIDLTNIGRGEAKNLRVMSETEIITDAPNLEIDDNESKIYPLEASLGMDEVDTILSEGNHIEEEARDKSYIYPTSIGMTMDESLSLNGKISLSILPFMLAEKKLDHYINIEQYPDRDRTVDDYYELRLNGNDSGGIILEEKLKSHDQPVTIENVSREILQNMKSRTL